MQVAASVLPSIEKAQECLFSWCYRKAEKQYNRVYQAFSNVYGLYSVATDYVALPQVIHRSFSVIGYIGVFDLAFCGPRLVSTITSFCQAKDLCSEMNAMIMIASEVSNLYSQFVQIIEGLKELKFLKPESFSWASNVSYVFMPLQVIFLGQSIEQARSIYDLNSNFQQQFQNPDNFELAAVRIHNVVRGLNFVKDSGDDLQSTLYLSKKCRLKDRAIHLLDRIKTSNDNSNTELVREGEKFLGILHNRLATRTTIDIANTVISVASTALSFLTLVIPANPISATAYAITNIGGIVLNVTDSLLLDKNPFQPSSNNWQKRIVRPIRQSIYSAASIIYTLAKVTFMFLSQQCSLHLRPS